MVVVPVTRDETHQSLLDPLAPGFSIWPVGWITTAHAKTPDEPSGELWMKDVTIWHPWWRYYERIIIERKDAKILAVLVDILPLQLLVRYAGKRTTAVHQELKNQVA